ncbi:MAG: class II aldolase/adducin family protein [Dethiobacter sp.]|jgi:L-ribulose-5-phosphate 4-epimerase|nr:class II aldolase/adducin family protein [Dethiobacter sp.]
MIQYRRHREEVLTYSRMLSADGYFGPASGTGGNVSMRVEAEGGDLIVITPSGKVYAELSAADICVARFDGSIIEGNPAPSIETGMHLAVYRNRPDVNAVIHTHQPYASIFALINQPIPPLFDEVTAKIGPVVEIIPHALSGSVELAENVASRLKNGCNCYIIQNHGALAVGLTLQAAYKHSGLLEKTAQAYYQALSTGKEVTVLPDYIVCLLTEQLKSEQQNEIARKMQLSISGKL